ncbi:ROK family protein [Thiosulfativibrio zosterae]|uniref:Fructokinase n=1 Tax=Thiosulfativibrio zosterae TaxID=2675053 RepID=A0A6F8PP11_9GAMM|nr:ROK family protein [Thiosulfativibrio zosterae]BBP43853.1 fructokinase [Thiosulfativibrio zosterae]
MRIGIDLGGTKIEAVALDEKGAVIFKQRMDTPKGDYAKTLAALIDLVKQAEQATQQTARSIGIGIPGAVSKKTGLIKNANSTWLIGQDLQGDIQSQLSSPVKLANDANCFALSEASDGAAAGAEVVFGVIIGTGCGGGLVVNGKILNGINAIGGEWGHNPLPWQTQQDVAMPCYCGLQGCTETFLSGSGFQAHYHHKTHQALSAQQIVALAQKGDATAQQHLENYCVWLAKGLASVINIVDPDIIVLGGGMSNIDYLYQRVPELWQAWVFSDVVETVLKPPKWGDSSGVRGAAWL